MINDSNISEYIQFLYLQKYKTEAPQEVLNSWENIPSENINGYLQELYQHWGLSIPEAQSYESQFLNPQTNKTINDRPYAQPITTPTNPHSIYREPAQKTNNPWKAIIVILILALMSVIAYLAYNLMYKPDNQQVQIIDTATEQPTPQVSNESPVPETPEQEDSTTDAGYEKVMTIKELFRAEEARDFNGILNTFSPYMEQYWDINYPTEEELSAAYQRTWDATKDNKNSNIQITKVNDSTYDVSSTYTYFFIKNQKQTTTTSKVRYVFDNENKIVKTYGL